MLQIYVESNKDCIKSNDSEFELNTVNKMLSSVDKNYKKVISNLENVTFIGDDKLISSINNEPISIFDLSTGCKTILNILYNKDKIISVKECGENYSDFIYNIDNGKIYEPYFLIPNNKDGLIDKVFELNVNGEKKIITGINSLEEWYSENV